MRPDIDITSHLQILLVLLPRFDLVFWHWRRVLHVHWLACHSSTVLASPLVKWHRAHRSSLCRCQYILDQSQVSRLLVMR